MISAPISLTATEARCGPYSTTGGRRKMHTGVWLESLSERELLEKQGPVGGIVLNSIFTKTRFPEKFGLTDFGTLVYVIRNDYILL